MSDPIGGKIQEFLDYFAGLPPEDRHQAICETFQILEQSLVALLKNAPVGVGGPVLGPCYCVGLYLINNGDLDKMLEQHAFVKERAKEEIDNEPRILSPH